jgi:hypothetical protein
MPGNHLHVDYRAFFRVFFSFRRVENTVNYATHKKPKESPRVAVDTENETLLSREMHADEQIILRS